MKRALVMWAGISLVGLGCLGLAVVDDDADGPSGAGSVGGEPMDASDASTSGGLTDGPSQDAVPDGPETCDSPVVGHFNCCNGTPCRGWCEPNGECNCGTVIGGCPAPTVCCVGGSLCVAETHCGGEDHPYDGPKYDGGTDCAPSSDNPYENLSCCEGVPCWGDCELHDGAWQCYCAEIPGGCGSFGLTCCWSAGCMPEWSCGLND